MTDLVKPTLHVVKRLVKKDDINWTSMLPEGVQWEMFSGGKRNLIAFLEMTGIDEMYFTEILTKLSPRIVIDVRQAPIFDFGKLNRRRVFEYFKSNNVFYFESPYLFSSQDLEASQGSFIAFGKNMKRLKTEGRDAGPILLLVKELGQDPMYLRFLPKLLSEFGDTKKWEAYALPSGAL